VPNAKSAGSEMSSVKLFVAGGT